MNNEFNIHDVLQTINNVNPIRREITLSTCNIIPYGSPSSCLPVLVVILNGKKPNSELITEALIHAGSTCRSVTKDVIFYVEEDKRYWQNTWMLFEPAFIALASQGVQYHIIFGSHVNNVLDPFAVHSRRQIKGLCEICNKNPAEVSRVDTWSFKEVLMCRNCSETVLF